MSVGYQIKEVLEQIMWMGVAFGIVGYFIYREWGRRRESMTMLERMTPEQLADIRRVDAEIEIERLRLQDSQDQRDPLCGGERCAARRPGRRLLTLPRRKAPLAAVRPVFALCGA